MWPGGGNPSAQFSGIDPARLPTTISTLDANRDRLRSSATSYKSQFEQHGLDTQPLTKLLGIASWIDDQMPMLRRRQHLAIAADQYADIGTKIVWIDETKVTPGAAAKSAADGKKLADDFKDELGDGDVPDDLWDQLQAQSHDADFVNAFYKELGPDQFYAITTVANAPGADGKPDPARQRLASATFGMFTHTATEGMNAKQKEAYWNTWLDDFHDPINGFRPDQLMPMLSVGPADKDFLLALGNRIFSPPPGQNVDEWMRDGPSPGDPLAQFYTAMSNNPEAAGEFMAQHPDLIDAGLTGGLNTSDARTDAFVAMVKAGTTGLHATNVKLSDENTAMILSDNARHSKNGEHPLSEVSLMYSEMIAQHWDDLQYGVTSPTRKAFFSSEGWDPKAYREAQDSHRPGIEASPDLWQLFVQESIRNPHAAASVSTLFDSSQKKYANDISNAQRSHPGAVGYMSFEKGLMGDFYATAYSKTAESLKDEQQQWVEEMNASRTMLVETATGLAFGGPQATIDAAKESGQELALSTLQGWIAQSMEYKPNDAPADLLAQIEGLKKATVEVSWEESMGDRASAMVAKGFPQPNLKPVNFNLDGQTSRTYTGDPYGRDGRNTLKPPPPVYIHGKNDDFIQVIKDNNGEVDVNKMTPEQRPRRPAAVSATGGPPAR
ncbi:hypothetical protein [Streptomyces sp. NPDC021020]|uniref:hypothetical protein n=1 Tax=Streptomyces sp. NPDC021020 TaxID=3365109 RepID=UPI0037A26A2B